MKPHIKVTSSALIQRDGAVLLNQFKEGDRTYYNLPGGIVESGENLHDALQREVLEETGIQVNEVGQLLLTWEYEPRRLDDKYGKRHKIGFVFSVSLSDDAEPQLPTEPDKNQVGVVWLPLDELATIDLQPAVGDLLLNALNESHYTVRFYAES